MGRRETDLFQRQQGDRVKSRQTTTSKHHEIKKKRRIEPMTMPTERQIACLAKPVKETQLYSEITNFLFETKISYGRMCVWFIFSDLVYIRFPRNEKLKMNTLFRQKWWNVFKRSTIWNKCVLLLLTCERCCKWYF